ncbi:hypothetical protein GR11A_00105 [Vibrio phage vB_VcorM_GR11A]|nr:hypothetical protein GR11A_00105 [Vibrio phage vB_VcorM_GR11A]
MPKPNVTLTICDESNVDLDNDGVTKRNILPVTHIGSSHLPTPPAVYLHEGYTLDEVRPHMHELVDYIQEVLLPDWPSYRHITFIPKNYLSVHNLGFNVSVEVFNTEENLCVTLSVDGIKYIHSYDYCKLADGELT